MNLLLLSLNSIRLDDFINNRLGSLSKFNKAQTDIYILDTFEVLNGLVFNMNNLKKQNLIIENRIDYVDDNIFTNLPYKGEIIKYSENKRSLKPYLSLVYSEYFTNSSFENHAKNQIFQNLQPKLRDINIKNKKSHLIDLLSPFLLAEIACYLSIFDTGKYMGIYGLESEMDIIKSIKKGKYENFSPYVKHKTEYHKIEF